MGISLGLHASLAVALVLGVWGKKPQEQVFEISLIHLGELSETSQDGGREDTAHKKISAWQPQAASQAEQKEKIHQERITLTKNIVPETSHKTSSTDFEKTVKELKQNEESGTSSLSSRAQGNAGSLGTGRGFGKAKATYTQLVLARLEQKKRYPRSAKRMHAQGVATLELVLRENGKLLSSRLVGSSGFNVLDSEVKSLAVRAAPYPKMPRTIEKESITLHVPVEFRLVS
jgi:TonB family protein